MAATFLLETLPVPVVATSGAAVTLQSILSQNFGPTLGGFTDIWLTYEGADFLAQNNFSYWDPTHPVVSSWYVNGADIGPGFSNQRHVTSAQFGSVTLHVGNDIGPYVYITVPISNPFGYSENIQFSLIVVDPSVASSTAANGTPSAADIVAEAQMYSARYSGVPNPFDCGWICMDLATAAGAALPIKSQSIDPTQNEEGGFWRIVYRGSDPNPVAHWQTLVQPGDIVRMAWTAGSFHTTTILGTNADGSINVFDNSASSAGMIGTHKANYDPYTIPSSVTIYRLSPDHLYLINGTSAGEVLDGSPYNNEIHTLAGNDIVNAGPRNDMIYLDGSGTKTVIGGGGTDTVILASTFAGAHFADSTGNALIVAGGLLLNPNNHAITVSYAGGSATLNSISILDFSDATLSIDASSSAATYASFLTVENANLNILRRPLSVSQATPAALQMDAHTLDAPSYGTQLIAQAQGTTVPALVIYDFFFGKTPSSAGVDFLTSFATQIQTPAGGGFSVVNSFVNLAATDAINPTSSFGATFGVASGVSEQAFFSSVLELTAAACWMLSTLQSMAPGSAASPPQRPGGNG